MITISPAAPSFLDQPTDSCHLQTLQFSQELEQRLHNCELKEKHHNCQTNVACASVF